MQSIYFKIFISLFMLIFISCKEGRTYENNGGNLNSLQKANWILGKWENQSEKGILVENWVQLNDSTLHGESYFIVENDTVFAESIQLAERHELLNYVVTVEGQNLSKPVSFIQTKASSKQLVFENPTHDYPQKIIYNRVGNDSLVAEISGIDGKKARKEVFRLKRKIK